MKIKYLLLPFGYTLLAGCSFFGGNNNHYAADGSGGYETIPLPPQKINSSAVTTPANPVRIKTMPASAPKNHASGAYVNSYPQRIQEDRANGTVTEIKVDTGKDLPDYYMYPSQQNPRNNNSDANISTPSWQISW